MQIIYSLKISAIVMKQTLQLVLVILYHPE